MNLSKYLGDKIFWKVTISLALPIAFQNMLTSSFALVDTLMVSMLGDISLAAAGMAAHLAGAVAANTTLPVIGIPITSKGLGGMDALLSTVMMPPGIPVATVAIDGAVNAALLAIQILAVDDGSLAEKLDAKRVKDAEAVLAKDAALQNV